MSKGGGPAQGLAGTPQPPLEFSQIERETERKRGGVKKKER